MRFSEELWLYATVFNRKLLYDITRQVAKGTHLRTTVTFVGMQKQQLLKLRVNIQAY